MKIVLTRSARIPLALALGLGAYAALLHVSEPAPVPAAREQLEGLGWDADALSVGGTSSGFGLAGRWVEVRFHAVRPAQAEQVDVRMVRGVPFLGWSLREIRSSSGGRR